VAVLGGWARRQATPMKPCSDLNDAKNKGIKGIDSSVNWVNFGNFVKAAVQ
jgi:hypothetical protein